MFLNKNDFWCQWMFLTWYKWRCSFHFSCDLWGWRFRYRSWNFWMIQHIFFQNFGAWQRFFWLPCVFRWFKPLPTNLEIEFFVHNFVIDYTIHLMFIIFSSTNFCCWIFGFGFRFFFSSTCMLFQISFVAVIPIAFMASEWYKFKSVFVCNMIIQMKLSIPNILAIFVPALEFFFAAWE